MSDAPLSWDGPPIAVVGAGVGDLTSAAREALAAAEVVVAAPRFAHLLAPRQVRLDWPSPLGDLAELLRRQQGRRLALLASGDPLFHGIGRWLLRHLPREALIFHPGVTSVAAACARVGWAWDEVETVSLHGRPLEVLRARLRNRRRYALLTDEANGPARVALELMRLGLERSRLYLCEDLGGPEERIRALDLEAAHRPDPPVHPLNVILLETAGEGTALREFPGLPDEVFARAEGDRGAMISKRTVRLAALSWLAPEAGDVGWDVGAGCGALAVEWALWNPRGVVHALEVRRPRLVALEENRRRFGVLANLHPHHGRAPEALAQLPDPDRVFVGGGGEALPAILEACWRRLRPGGRLVATAVTEESRAELLAFAAHKAARWQEVAVAEGDRLAGRLILRPALSVRLLEVRKQ